MERFLEWARTQDPLLLQAYAFGATAGLLFVVGWLLTRFAPTRKADDLRRRPKLMFGPLTFGLAGALPLSEASRSQIRTEVSQAGFYQPLAAEQFLALRNAIVVGWTVLVAALLLAAYDPVNDPSIPILIVGAVGLIVLFALPRLWLQGLARARVQRIEAGLPDALDMLSMCLSGGVPLQTALDRVGPELYTAHPDVALEFEIIARQAEVHTLEEALSQFAKRLQVDDISGMAALVSQTSRLGANVGVALRDYADGIRRASRQRAEERGNKVSVQMILPVALCLAPPVYILLLAPAVMELRDFVLRQSGPGGVLTQDMGSQLAAYQQQQLTGQSTRPTRTTIESQSFADPSGEVLERVQNVGRPGRRATVRSLTGPGTGGADASASGIPPAPIRPAPSTGFVPTDVSPN